MRFDSFNAAAKQAGNLLTAMSGCNQMQHFKLGGGQAVLEVQNDNTSMAAQNAKTFADHYSIATRYENTAKELQVKVDEYKKLLQHYDDKSYLYGRHGQDFRSHTEALLRKYKLAAEKTTTYAAFHQKMASELAKRDYAADAEPQRQVSNR